MDNSFSSLINSASGILVLLPTKPYFDQVAAGLSLFLSLKGAKEASISCPSPMLVEFNRLVGVNKITQELGNKNLVMKFIDYKATDIERVSYDIENGEFKLTVIPKPGVPSPKKEQIVLNYSGISADTVVLIGGANDSHFPSLTLPELAGAKLLHIGTRALSLSTDKTIMSFARPASSVSELIASLIKESGLELDPDVATNLVAGIEEGSNHFSSQEVTADTFEVFAQLLRAGGRRFSKDKVRERAEFPPGAIPGQEIKVEGIEKKEEPPSDWLEPKIYKGTSIS